jgi:hypothetical protein
LSRFSDRLVAALNEVGIRTMAVTHDLGRGRIEIVIHYSDPSAASFSIRLSLDGNGKMTAMAWAHGFPAEGGDKTTGQVILEHSIDLEDTGRANRMSTTINAIVSAVVQARLRRIAGDMPAETLAEKTTTVEVTPALLAAIAWTLQVLMDLALDRYPGSLDTADVEIAGMLSILAMLEDAGYDGNEMPTLRSFSDRLRGYGSKVGVAPEVRI